MRIGMRATTLALLAALVLAAAWLSIGDGPGSGIGSTRASPKESPAPRVAATTRSPAAAALATIAAGASETAMQRAERLSAATFMTASEVEPLGVDRLAGYLPAQLAGYARTATGGARSEQIGLPTTTATATYVGADGSTLELRVSDLAGPKGVAAFAAWAVLGEQDNSSDEGYERTRVDGDRAYYQEWDRTSGRGEEAAMLAGRLLVSVSGNPPNPQALQTALAGVDLAGIAKLAKP